MLAAGNNALSSVNGHGGAALQQGGGVFCAYDYRLIQGQTYDSRMGVHAFFFGYDGGSPAHLGQDVVGGVGDYQDIPIVEFLNGLLFVLADTQVAGNRTLGNPYAGNPHIAHQLNLQQVGSTGNTQGHTGGDDHHIAVVYQAGGAGYADYMVKELVGIALLLHHNGTYTPGEVHLAIYLRVSSAADNGTLGAEAGDHPGGAAGFGNGDNGPGSQVVGSGAGSVGNGHGHIGLIQLAALVETGLIIDVLFRTHGNPDHGFQGLNGIIAGSGLTGKHDGAGAVINGVGHVCRFCTGGAGVLHHGVQHLGGGDDLLAGQIGLFDEFLLDDRDLFQGNFYAQVAAGHHDAVGHVDNLVDIPYAVNIFNLGDDADIVIPHAFQKSAHFQNIIGGAGEGSSDKVEVLLHGKFQVLAVLFAGEGQGELDAGDVDALTGRYRAAVDHAADNIRVGVGLHSQLDQAVVNENTGTHRHILGKAGEGDGGNRFVAHYFAGSQGKLASGFQHNLGRVELLHADFGAFGIQEQSYRQVQFFPQGLDLVGPDLLLRMGLVGKVQPDYVHTGFHKLPENVPFVGGGAQGADDFRLPHDDSRLPSKNIFERIRVADKIEIPVWQTQESPCLAGHFFSKSTESPGS